MLDLVTALHKCVKYSGLVDNPDDQAGDMTLFVFAIVIFVALLFVSKVLWNEYFVPITGFKQVGGVWHILMLAILFRVLFGF